MDQNNLIAQLIPWYQKYLLDTEIAEEKAAAKLRPSIEFEAEPDDSVDLVEQVESSDKLLEGVPEMEVKVDEEIEPEIKTESTE